VLAFLNSIGYESWVLPTLLALPVAGALVILLHGSASKGEGTGGLDDAAAMFPRRITLFTFLLEFVVSIGLWWVVAPGETGFRGIVDLPWIRTWGIRFAVGVDGISVMLVLLTTFIMPLVVLGGWTSVRTKLHAYHALMLILTAGMLGVFMARDLFLFYVMWEIMLVPMYFIIGIWGGARRLYAALKFFIFTMVGSLLMLVAILYLGIKAADPATGVPNFAFDQIFAAAAQTPQGGITLSWLGIFVPGSTLLFLAFFSAFAVKVPMFPFHTWLPDAHVEAPTAGSVILAGILLKMGTYGFLRFSIPILPAATVYFVPMMVTLAIIAIIYGALVAMMQPDMKKLVAYSSVSHMGFVMLGMFALNPNGLNGSIIQQINHGISTGALFLIVGIIYERRHTREIAQLGGLSNVMPAYAVVFLIMTMSSIGLPLLNGFIGEFTIMAGALQKNLWWAVAGGAGIVLGAAYMLWLYQRTMFGKLDNPANQHLKDMNWREWATLIPLIIMAFWIGLYPAPFFRALDKPVNKLVSTIQAVPPGAPQAAREVR